MPNVYVTATAIRPITDNGLPLTVARGFVPLTVEKPGTRLPLTLAAAALSRSQTFQTIEVRTAPRAQVTLAVVDEGILQRKSYQTPDPYGYFYQKRALEVSAFDVYPFLLPELGTSSSGGDAADLARRTITRAQPPRAAGGPLERHPHRRCRRPGALPGAGAAVQRGAARDGRGV
ncbi:MAG: hypothetical protein WKG07_10110 [Hymenobacter sp.]